METATAAPQNSDVESSKIQQKSAIDTDHDGGIVDDDHTQNNGDHDKDEENEVDDDLEDGEIESEDDDEPIVVSVTATTTNLSSTPTTQTATAAVGTAGTPTIVHLPKSSPIPAVPPTIKTTTTMLDIMEAKSKTSPVMSSKAKTKRRINIPEDDWAGDLEYALAAALKKDGIEPPMPKLSKGHIDSDNCYDKSDKDDYVEEVRRPSKRKKRHDREKKKSKRLKHSDGDRHVKHNDVMDADYDEDEMVCVRGGSPTPGNFNMAMSLHPIARHRASPSGYNESDDSYHSSDDSYDSIENRKMSYDDRRQSRRAKDRRNRGGAGSAKGGAGAGGGGAALKRRNRHDSDGGDDCPRSHDARAPRKLELCKFYLMDCCAKKDKCSYMHADFPCKYYYLGMECVYKTECKFSHGEPLTEQLKNILLKHIETAPKEILGNFRRISREAATQQLLATHAKLCSERGVENTFELPSSNFAGGGGGFRGRQKSRSPGLASFNRQQSRSPSANRGGGGGNPFASSAPIQPQSVNFDEEDWDKEDWDKPTSSTNSNATNLSSAFNAHKGNDKPRKSRWQDLSGSQSGSQPAASPAGPTLDILSLRNLKGVITPEQIERLEAIGIENLEQISQLTVAQLNSVGLTISQINEIQLNAMNMQKLGLGTTPAPASKATPSVLKSPLSTGGVPSTAPVTAPPSATHSTACSFNDDSQSMQDVDMRVLVGAVQGTSATSTSSRLLSASQTTESSNNSNHTTSGSQSQQLQDLDIASPEPTPNSGKLITSTGRGNTNTMDFSQYLKDSNLKDADKTNFNDILNDDDPLNEDEPELLIDESQCDGSDDENGTLPKRSQDTLPAAQEPPTPTFTSKGEDDDNWDDDGGGGGDGEAGSVIPAAENSQGFLEVSGKSGNDYSDSWHDSASNDKWKVDNSGMDQWQDNNSGWSRGGNSSRWSNTDADQMQQHGRENARKRPAGHHKKGGNKDLDMWSDSSNKDDDAWKPPHEEDYRNKDHSSDYYGGGSRGFYGNRNKASNDPRNRYGSTSSHEDKNPFYDRDSSSHRDPRLGSSGAGFFNSPSDNSRSDAPYSDGGSSQPVDNYCHDWDAQDDIRPSKGKESKDKDRSIMSEEATHQDIVPSVIREPSPPPKYQRASIYDGTGGDDEDESHRGTDDDDRDFTSDRDLRLPSFTDSGDIDLRLPFKPVMTNYTPATEIDGSIASHAPITYKVYEVIIPKPDYSEIRRTMTVREKTLDPRLRRIFCLKEPIADQFGSDNDVMTVSLLSPQKTSIAEPMEKPSHTVLMGGPRLDPRRRKENLDNNASLSIKGLGLNIPSTGASSSSGLGQNVDIRLLLQKSVWYKNLNSKFKIMVNQQLALVSTELKKFHQDPNPDKVFDMKFLVTNQYLQQVLTNLGIFIDGNGQILQLDADNDDSLGVVGPMMGGPGGVTAGSGNMMMPGSGMMIDPTMPQMGGMGIDYMRNSPGTMGMGGPMNAPPPFMGGGGGGPGPGMMNSYGGPRFDIRPNLQPIQKINPFGGNRMPLGGGGVSPYDDYGNDSGSGNPFDQAMGNDMGMGMGGNSSGGGGKYYGGPDRPSSGNRGGGGNRNFRQGGNSRNNSNNDRWWSGGGGGGGRKQPRNSNYDNRGGGGGGDRDNMGGGGRRSEMMHSQSPPPPQPQPAQQEEEECWD